MTISDTLIDGAFNNLNSTLASITFVSATTSSTSSTLYVGGSATFTTSTTITAISSLTAFIQNSVVVTMSSPGQTNNVSDTSDDGDDSDGNTTDDPTEIPIVPNPDVTVSKTATATDSNGDGLLGVNDTITYTIVVSNTGNMTLTGISFDDTLKNGYGTALSLNGPITFVSSSKGSVSGTLLFSEAASYTASYTITQADVDSGLVSNSLLVTASSPGQEYFSLIN